MKVLVATCATQGQRPTDFNFAREGELVGLDDAHTAEEEMPDDECGCQRSLEGLETGKSTTTFEVDEVNLTPESYAQIIRQQREEGYGELPTFEATIRAEVELLLRTAAQFQVGSIVERRGGEQFQLRAEATGRSASSG